MNAGFRVLIRLAGPILCVLAPFSMARGQDCIDNPNRATVPVMPQQFGVDPCGAGWSVTGAASTPVWQQDSEAPAYGFAVSSCWRNLYNTIYTAQDAAAPVAYPPVGDGPVSFDVPLVWDLAGFSLNIDLHAPPSIGDFLPPAETLDGTSAALVPSASAKDPTGWQGLSRPTVQGVVDLVTGLPLVQVEDLSLPLDGATFRLMRTRSQDSIQFDSDSPIPPDRWWDWVGEGWMISENPLLLIDSAIANVVGDQPRTTYLVLDAHHSIPFQLIESTGRYESPARFRARLAHNGVWNATERTWTTRPTSYTVSLYDGALTFTFVAIYEDVPEHTWSNLLSPESSVSSLHERPILLRQIRNADPNSEIASWNSLAEEPNPGLGIPYYGLCTQIADAYGHKVEIDYCGLAQRSMDDPATPCVECEQNCPSKGQIRCIKVSSAEGVQWTLMYAYRIAPALITGDSSEFLTNLPEAVDKYGRRVIDSIYVYEGDQSAFVVAESLCEPFSSSEYQTTSGDIVDAIDGGPTLSLSGPLANWRYRVRYHYSCSDADPEQAGLQLAIDSVPLLLKTSVETRVEPGNQSNDATTLRETIFKYSGIGSAETAENRYASIEAVFSPEDVDRAISAAHESSQASWMSSNHLALWAGESGVPGTLSNEPQLSESVLACAAKRLGHNFETPKASIAFDNGASQYGPSWLLLTTALPDGSQYIKQVPATLVTASKTSSGSFSAEVQVASLRDVDGSIRHYRFFRLAVDPAGSDPSLPGGAMSCDPSAFYSPYTWMSALDNLSEGGVPQQLAWSDPPSDYTEARWITVIDEFASRAEMADESPYSTDTLGFGTKPGQLSRRVVEVSASGVLLRDRLWQFSQGGVLVSGSGIGEEYVYDRAIAVLSANGVTLPPPPLFDTSGPLNEITAEDPLGHLRNEIVLVEHRSVGWSVAYLGDTGNDYDRGATDGFVRFYEYKPYMYHSGGVVDSNEDCDKNDDGWCDDLVVSLELHAEGVKQGRAFTNRNAAGGLNPNPAGGPKLYTRQVFRPANPDVAAEYEQSTEVQFLTPRSSLLSDQDVPAPGTVLTDCAITHSLSYRQHVGQDDVPVPERPIRSKAMVGAARHQRPGSSADWYFPVEREWYSESGAMEWAASGLVLNPLEPAPSPAGVEELQSLTFTRYIRDSLNRPIHTIMDADDSAAIRQHPAAPVVHSSEVGDPPDGWARIPASGALNYVTTFGYNNPGESLSDMYFPNGRRWASRILVITHQESDGPSAPLLWNTSGFDYVQLDELEPNKWFAREYIFNDIETRTDSSHTGSFYSRMLGEIRDYAGRDATGGPVRTRRVYFAVDPGGPAGAIPVSLPANLVITPATQPRFVEEAQVGLVLDANGRPIGASLLEVDETTGALSPVGSKEINNLVDVIREREIDGTISRVTRNKLGQPLRSYLGTVDLGWSTPNDPSNMVLLDRTEYGSGVNDAWLPTISREYTYHPDWANNYYDTPPSEDDDPLTVDNDGYITKTSYDWRMRAVRVDSYGENESGDRDLPAAPRLSTTLSILDHLDRPIIQVAFGASAGDIVLPDDDLNPCLRTPDNELTDPHPDAKRYLGSSVSPRPISLVETFYEPDGSVREVRTYDVSSSESSPRWHSEYAFYGRNGAQVYAQRPESPLSKGEIDGLGRLVRQSSLVPKSENWTYELGRTDYTIDADGNIVDSARYERALFDTADSLTAEGSPNGVRTRSVSWFDPAKRQVAASDLGTEQIGGFIAGPASYARPINDGNLSEPYLDFSDPESAPTLVDPNNWDPGSLGLRPLLSVNHYDLATGRLTHTRNPDGSITETLYDRAGRVKSKIENRFGDASLQRRTDYGYTFGRLTKIIARRTNENVTGRDQVTTVEYGAEIVAEKREGDVRLYDIVSRRNDLVGRMSLPNSESGAVTTNNDIVLRYTFRGEIAERIDARGAAIRYFYDALGRLTEEVIGRYNDAELTEFSDKHPDNMNPASGAPIDRIGYIKHTYDDAGRPRDVIAYVARDGDVVSHNRFIYDVRGNLVQEIQSHGQLIDSEAPEDVPSILYNWSYEATDDQSATQIGHNRLVSMVYPIHGQNEARVVSFNYGNNGSTDDVLSRLSGIDSKLESASFSSTIAQFQYIGVSRRRSLRLGVTTGSITADFHLDQEVGLAGLDRFGRVQDYNFKNVSGATLFRSQYGYDTAGNRTWAHITQASVDGLSQNNVRSQLNQYNQLNQLIGTQVGTINTANVPVSISDVIRSDTWSLDLLGNWSGPLGASSAGRFSSGNLDGGNGIELGGYQSTTFMPWEDPAGVTAGSDVTATTHFVNAKNEITKIGTHYGNPNAGVADTFLYDAAGNLVFDGIYFYQYDAFNRLLQVNYAHLDVEPQATPTVEDIVADELVKHHTYDGLGRLIRTQSPFPSVDEAEDLRTERFYYDGVRRIQEIVIDPLIKLSELTQPMGASTIELQIAATNSEFSQSEAAEGNLDKSATPLAVEKVQLEGDPLPSNGAQLSETPAVRLVREYIWGPGDGAAGVDELLVQFDEDRKPWWVIQDAGGDIVALCDNGTSIEGAPFVAAQWTYDAYGSVVSADHLSPHPFMHAGHKGLFLDRLDVGVADSAVPGAEALESPRLVPFAHALYHNRNRVYNPQFGRFMQADPNKSGLSLLNEAVYHGVGTGRDVDEFDIRLRFGDGPNVHQYLVSSPWTRSDPLGLGVDDLLPGPGDFITEVFAALVEDYSANLDFDVDWAIDFGLPDDDHSRLENSWMLLAMGRGLYNAFEIGFGEYSFNPLDVFASASRKRGPAGTPVGTGRARGGFTIHVQNGQRAHKNYEKTLGPGYKFDVTIKGGTGGSRVDAIDVDNKIVRELKPDTPSGRARGAQQLARYVRELARHPNAKVRGNYTAFLDLYRP